MTGENVPTYPCQEGGTQPHLIIEPVYRDEITGALYVHKDLECALGDWETEQHIGPINLSESFGDVDSWAQYIKGYGPPNATLAIWNAQGLRATLDYPEEAGIPGRCQWIARCPFIASIQWRAWTALANGNPLNQRQLIERLEDLAEDIREPAPTDIVTLLRSLRASVNSVANTELRADGTTNVMFNQNTSVKSGAASIDLPAAVVISIPVLKGHIDQDGRPVQYKIDVRLRVSVDDNAHLVFRLSMPTAERVLEAVYEDRVKYAKSLLGDKYQLLRGAD